MKRIKVLSKPKQLTINDLLEYDGIEMYMRIFTKDCSIIKQTGDLLLIKIGEHYTVALVRSNDAYGKEFYEKEVFLSLADARIYFNRYIEKIINYHSEVNPTDKLLNIADEVTKYILGKNTNTNTINLK
jgi:hypothetical protein